MTSRRLPGEKPRLFRIYTGGGETFEVPRAGTDSVSDLLGIISEAFEGGVKVMYFHGAEEEGLVLAVPTESIDAIEILGGD